MVRISIFLTYGVFRRGSRMASARRVRFRSRPKWWWSGRRLQRAMSVKGIETSETYSYPDATSL